MLRFLTAGESHGPALTAILEGMPAGLPLTPEDLAHELARRQLSYGAGGRMKIEQDTARILGGVMAGHTTGAPIALLIENRDYAKWRDRDIPPMTTPRPGHADLTGAIKYGYRDLRLALERASARETAARVAVGAICKALLRQFNIQVGSYVTAIGGVHADPARLAALSYPERFALAEQNDLRCPDAEAAEAMRRRVWETMQARDTVGGVFEVVAIGLPPGLGSHVHWDRRLSGRLMGAVGSIHAIKGVEIGPAFENADRWGTEVHDEIFLDEAEEMPEQGETRERKEGGEGGGERSAGEPGEGRSGGRLVRRTNRAGGLEGGITTGEPLVLRVAMKPISTTLNPLRSVNLAAGRPETTTYERSDFNAVPRAGVVAEAMVAFVLADALLEKLGGDSLDEMRPRFAALRQARLEDLPMDNVPWRFGFE
ncbi:MAG: chorismate synthase [Caldilineales bacterium]|nr:chorismate synthase [Caldilineales bacterium]MDW8316742.1 chorismate synthase [Anaerolineae bacterium]